MAMPVYDRATGRYKTDINEQEKLKQNLSDLGYDVSGLKPKAQAPQKDNYDKLIEKLYKYDPKRFDVAPVGETARQREAYENMARSREAMSSFGDVLRRRAMGAAPSQAELQLQAAFDQNQRGLAAALAGQRGRSAGLALRGITQQAAQGGQQLASQAALLRAQEQAQAEAALGNYYNQLQQADLASAQLGLGGQQLSFQQAVEQARARQAYELARGGDIARAIGMQKTAEEAAAQRAAAREDAIIGGLLGSAGAIGAGFAMKSDKASKKEIRSAGDEAKSFLDELTAYTFKYKGSEDPMMGIMAQDAEKSKIGKYLVEKNGGYKVLNNGKTMSAMLASLAYLNDRLNKMEGK